MAGQGTGNGAIRQGERLAVLLRRRREKVIVPVDGPEWLEAAARGSHRAQQSLRGRKVGRGR